METNKPHLDEGCPGRDYFNRRDKELKPLIREAVTEAIGDVPKHMRMAAGNRMWLVWLSAFVVVFGILLIAHLT